MTIFTLYQYTNRDSGKRYIGATKDPVRRARLHANGRSKARAFNAAVKLYGIEAFAFQVLAVFDDVPATAYHEQAAILKFGTLAPNGYNLTAGAPHTIYGGPLSPETRKAMSGNKHATGRKHTPEELAHLSAINKGNTRGLGYKHTDEARAAIGATWKGKKRPAETRARMSVAQKGNQHWLGRKHTGASRAAMSAAKTNLSPEARANISAAAKAAWARRKAATK